MSESAEYTRRLITMLNTALGSDILSYLTDKNVTDVMVNWNGNLIIDHLTKGSYYTGIVIDEADRMRVINAVATAFKTECNFKSPSLSANLPGIGYRFQAEVPPISEGPLFVIRKPSILNFTLQNYLNNKQITEYQHQAICAAVRQKHNILIVGGTGSGKTTLANAVLAEIAKHFPSERIIIIEDSKELVASTLDTNRLFTTRDFDASHRLRACMRLNPSRIIIGEIRDGITALGLLKAFNSGHSGGLTTIHADSAIQGLKKMLQYLGEAAHNPDARTITEAINLVMYIEKTSEGRKVKEMIMLENRLTADGEFIWENV